MADEQEATAALSCCVRGCKKGEIHLLEKCFQCTRYLHMDCCEESIILKNKLAPATDPEGNKVVVCTKKCWNALQRSTSGGLRFCWTRDGKNGVDDPNTSEAILLNWMTEGDNYIKYRGFKDGGKRKIDKNKEIAALINAAGVIKTRDHQSVKKKISFIEKQMRSALDWESTSTGAGLMESSLAKDRKNFHDTLLERCPHFVLLEPIFRDRVSGHPRFTGFNIFNAAGAVPVRGRAEEEEAESLTETEDNIPEDNEENMSMESGNELQAASSVARMPIGLVSVNSPTTRLDSMVLHGNRTEESESDVSRSTQRSVAGTTSSRKKRSALEGFNILEQYQQQQSSMKDRQMKLKQEENTIKRLKIEEQKRVSEELRKLKEEENNIRKMEFEDRKLERSMDRERKEIHLKNERMEYRVNLFKKYKDLRSQDSSYAEIANLFSEMIEFFPCEEKAKFKSSPN